MIEDIKDELVLDGFVDTAKEIFLKTGKPGFILISVYDILISRGEIEPIEEQNGDLMYHVEGRMKFEAAQRGTLALRQLSQEKGTPQYQKKILDECKKQIVANYFTLQNQLDNF